MRKLNRQKISAWILTVALALTMLPVSALAEESEQWEPDESGVYSVNKDYLFEEMVAKINAAQSGASLQFSLVSKAAQGGGRDVVYTSSVPIQIAADVTVKIKLGTCTIKFSGISDDTPVIDNKGTLTIESIYSSLSQYANIGSDGQTIHNSGTMELNTCCVKTVLENTGTLTAEHIPDYPCEIANLVNSGTVTAEECEFSSITATGGTLTLNTCRGTGEGISLSGDSELHMIDGYYFTKALTLADTSKMDVDGSWFWQLRNAVCGEEAALTIESGEFGFNPTAYISDGHIVTRSQSGDSVQNFYKVTKLEESATAPELTVTPADYAYSGQVWVTISTATDGAQVFYSLDETAPIDSQTDVKASRGVNVPNGTLLRAIAVKDGCPPAEYQQTISAPEYVYTAPAPEITPDDHQTYTDSVRVEIAPPKNWTPASTSEMAIYYTTDGSTPGYSTANTVPGGTLRSATGPTQGEISAVHGIRYTGPFTLTQSKTVMAVVVLASGDQSGVASRQYTIVPGGSGGGTGPSGGGGGSSGGSSSSGGSDSNQSSTSTTTKNPDGTTTTTTKDKSTGTVTEVTKGKDGTLTTVETKKDGTVTETVKTEGMTSTVVTAKDGTITKAEVNLTNATTSQTVILPVGVPVVSNVTFAPKVEIHLAKNLGSVKVAIPVERATTSTVAVLVAPDGSEKVVPTSIATAEGVALTLNGSATVKIIDNSKSFSDLPASFWATDSINFVTSRELFNGTSTATFTPDAPMTREMLMTVLARLDGADTTVSSLAQGMAWATEKGISDGSNPGGSISREQLATMLYRYTGSPAADASLAGFNDADSVGGFAREAMQWAVGNGIISGTGNGTLDPQGEATRAQVAAMLQRYIVSMNG